MIRETARARDGAMISQVQGLRQYCRTRALVVEGLRQYCRTGASMVEGLEQHWALLVGLGPACGVVIRWRILTVAPGGGARWRWHPTVTWGAAWGGDSDTILQGDSDLILSPYLGPLHTKWQLTTKKYRKSEMLGPCASLYIAPTWVCSLEVAAFPLTLQFAITIEFCSHF